VIHGGDLADIAAMHVLPRLWRDHPWDAGRGGAGRALRWGKRNVGSAWPECAAAPLAILTEGADATAIPQNSCSLLSALHSIVHFTEHLAIFWYCLAALAPWKDMVCLHFFYVELLLAYRTDTVLLSINLCFRLFVESAQIQGFFVLC